MAAPKKPVPPRGARPAPEMTQDRERVAWEMKTKGFTVEEIARQLKVHHTTVSRAIVRIRKREYVEFAKTREQHKIDQTRFIEHIASQAMRSWEKSLKPQRRQKATSRGEDEQTTREMVDREGNPTYLYLVLKCLDDIRKIWGFDVLPAAQDVGSSLADEVRKLDERAKRYEAEIKAGTPGGTPPPAAQGTGEVPA